MGIPFAIGIQMFFTGFSCLKPNGRSFQFCSSILIYCSYVLKEAVKKTKIEMLEYLETELKRESEAAEQRMTHKLQRIILQLQLEKTAAIVEMRKEEQQRIMGTLEAQKKYRI